MAIGYAVMNSSNSDSCVGYELAGVEIPFKEQPISYQDLCAKKTDKNSAGDFECKPVPELKVRLVDES